MKIHDEPTEGLTKEDREVFDLLGAARREYEQHLGPVGLLVHDEFHEPSAEDYRWEKPMTFVLTH